MSTAYIFNVSFPLVLATLLFCNCPLSAAGDTYDHAAYNLTVADVSTNDILIELYANSTDKHENKTYYVEYSPLGHEGRGHHQVVEVTADVSSNNTEVRLQNLTAYTFYNVCIISVEDEFGAVGNECTIVSTKYDPFNRKAVAAMLIGGAIIVTLVIVQLLHMVANVDETTQEKERQYILEMRKLRQMRKSAERMSRPRKKKKRSDYGSIGASPSGEHPPDETVQSEEPESEDEDPTTVLVENEPSQKS